MKALATLVLVMIGIMSTHPLLPDPAPAKQTDQTAPPQRHCIGLLWCTEQSDNSTSTDRLLWLYSAEERGSYSRLAVRRLYSIEEDPTRDLPRPLADNKSRQGTVSSASLLWGLASYGNLSWEIFGGVLGMDTTPKGTRVKLFLVSL